MLVGGRKQPPVTPNHPDIKKEKKLTLSETPRFRLRGLATLYVLNFIALMQQGARRRSLTSVPLVLGCVSIIIVRGSLSPESPQALL